ncbi:MAG: type IX secretion system membrane protein PorP/SprF [Chitinophagales bacterium]|nr:type IX secretion system membrane protein PorP/SprF [Chitinophagales bacterium]
MQRYFLLASLITMLNLANAQQDAMYSMYMFNGLFLNPAYAGSHEVISAMAIYRHQWAGFDGAPRTFNASIHAPFKRDQYALGATIMNDRLGLTNMFSVIPAFSYRIKVRKSRICLGIQTGFTYYQQRNSDAILPDGLDVDQVFSVNQNLPLFNVGFGIYIYGKRYFIGASVPHLIPNSLREEFNLVKAGEKVARQYNHYLLTAGYIFGKDGNIVKVKPTFLMKYVQGDRRNLPQFDFNLNFLFIERLWIGGGWRLGGDYDRWRGESAIAMLEAKITPQLRVGYAYDITLNRTNPYQGGTHEIMLGYDFSYNRKRFVTPRYVKYF